MKQRLCQEKVQKSYVFNQWKHVRAWLSNADMSEEYLTLQVCFTLNYLFSYVRRQMFFQFSTKKSLLLDKDGEES